MTPTMRWMAPLALAAPILFGAACKKSDDGAQSTASTESPSEGAGPSATVDEAARKEADEIFAGRCTPCHGPTGAGDGPASKGLTPPPRNFHDKAWQTGASDEHIAKIIQFGGAAVGKSPAMPPNPDLMGKPAVIAALREKIRSFGK